MQQLLLEHRLILMEAAIVERLRRSGEVSLHQQLANAHLIYEPSGRQALSQLYLQYIEVALSAQLPILICTPTWRANRERVMRSGINRAINIDAVRFTFELRQTALNQADKIKIGGMLGCRNDCYKPEDGLTADDAEQFHSWQAGQLAMGGVDFLFASTIPNVEEALGMAKAMEKTGKPYIISFVISRDGVVLDGTRLIDAIGKIDTATCRAPIGYMVNCAYPTFLCATKQPRHLFHRLIGYQANASALSHTELDQAAELHAETVTDWGERMLELNRDFDVRILGGCCGTTEKHLRHIADTKRCTDS